MGRLLGIMATFIYCTSPLLVFVNSWFANVNEILSCGHWVKESYPDAWNSVLSCSKLDQRINNLSTQASMSLADLTRNSFQSGISPTKVSLNPSLRPETDRRVQWIQLVKLFLSSNQYVADVQRELTGEHPSTPSLPRYIHRCAFP